MENWSNPDFGCWCGATCLPCQNMPWEQAHSSVLHCNLHGTKKGRNLNYRKQSTKFHRETKKRFKRHCSCCASLFEKSWGSDAHNIHAPPHPPQKQQLASISSILPPPKKKKKPSPACSFRAQIIRPTHLEGDPQDTKNGTVPIERNHCINLPFRQGCDIGGAMNGAIWVIYFPTNWGAISSPRIFQITG